MAQTVSPPTLIDENRCDPGTLVGVGPVFESPWSGAMSPAPQQYAVPSDVSAHASTRPAAIAVNLRPPATGVGVRCAVESPVPSMPKVFRPQQYAAPVSSSAQANPVPVLIAV